MTSVYILTSEYNEYDQNGEYFEAVFFHKPTAKELIENGLHPDKADYVLKTGGGRQNYEHVWYYLKYYSE